MDTLTPPNWGTRKEAALRAKCSAKTIDRWIKSGLLPAAKVGKLVRVNLDDIDRLLLGGDAA